MALGVAWILDGLEITIASNVGPDLTQKATLHMSAGAVADIATWYLIGEVLGALFFGRLSDKLGRKNLFMVTLAVYLVGSGLTAATPAGGHWFIFLYLTRIVAGAGIGGEYAAINSAIDEMIPAKYRGRVDLAVNGTYWAGAFLGTLATLFILNNISASLGWRDRSGSSGHQGRTPAGGREQGHRYHADQADRLPGPAPGAVFALSEPVGARRGTDDHPVVPLQRDLLHLRARA
jgi:MFS family permease